MKTRVAELDGLRGVAILLVMFFHFIWFPRFYGVPLGAGAESFFAWQESAWCGVDLFFVLSGFLITGLLSESRGRAGYFRVFYWRRAVRIFPLYVLLLLGWTLWTGGEDGALPSLWTYTSNFRLAALGWEALPAPVGHLWTLAIEEQFYLAWPLVIWALPRRAALALCALLVVGCPLARAFAPEGLAAYVLTPYRMDAFAAGAGLALLGRVPVYLCGAGAVVSGSLLVALGWARGGLRGEDPLVLTWGLSLLALFFACVIGLARAGVVGRLLRARLLRTFGTYSYCLYLVHQPVCLGLLFGGLTPALLTPYLALNLLVFFACPLVVSLVIAALSWRFLERPLESVKARVGYGPV